MNENRFAELEDKVERLIMSKPSTLYNMNRDVSTTLKFISSSYFIDLSVDALTRDNADIIVTLNGVSKTYHNNFVCDRLKVDRTNTLTIEVKTGGLISKKIKIEGIGVKLLSI